MRSVTEPFEFCLIKIILMLHINIMAPSQAKIGYFIKTDLSRVIDPIEAGAS